MSNSQGRNEGIRMVEEFVCQAMPLPSVAGGNGNSGEAQGEAVVFAEDYSRAFWQDCMAFHADYRGRSLRCAISWQALAVRFGVIIHNWEEAEAAFLNRRQAIQELAKALILAGKVSADDEVVIK
jgi:hypothetical protein